MINAFQFPAIKLSLPPWIGPFLEERGSDERGLVCPSDEERMALVVELARRNVAEGTGGPFAAAVFEAATGRLLAPGVNRVEPLGCSVAHAEIVAIMVAQRLAGTYDLGAGHLPAAELFASAEPCAMCYGAVPWSGVRRLVYGATKEAAEAVGFDEGSKPEDWHRGLEERGIAVQGGLLSEEAAQVLADYAAGGSKIYNSAAAGRPDS